MQRTCPVCEAENRPNARYCRKCATPLPTHEAPYAQTQIFVPSESLPDDGAAEPMSQPTRPIGLDEAGRGARHANRRVMIAFVAVALVLSGAFWWKQRMQSAPALSAADVATAPAGHADGVPATTAPAAPASLPATASAPPAATVPPPKAPATAA
ncbi:MAG: zinc-ribbon domain-containing protein, partial [Burkholderiales bacterium]|nr:zinc-ribbon domain-containing protein [Burkholderiales bacterium]